jgi:hypothetical protein
MYPDKELKQLASQKASLQRDIGIRRVAFAEAAGRVSQPLEWLDRVLDFARRFSPYAQLAAVPLGFLVKRTLFPRFKILGSVVRWGPLVMGVVRGVSSLLRGTPAPSVDAEDED